MKDTRECCPSNKVLYNRMGQTLFLGWSIPCVNHMFLLIDVWLSVKFLYSRHLFYAFLPFIIEIKGRKEMSGRNLTDNRLLTRMIDD